MKKSLVVLSLALTVISSLALPRDSHAKDFICASYECSGDIDCLNKAVFSGLISSTTLGPIGTSISMHCSGQAADIDSALLEREAVMVLEENRVYNPSYIGSYAEKIGADTLRDAARDVLQNGVRQ